MFTRLRILSLRVIATALFVLAASLWPMFPRPGTLHDRALQYVASQKDTLPTEYDGISVYPIEYQDAILAALSTEARKAYWQRHFLMVAERDQRLTPQQRSLLQEYSTAVANEDSNSRLPMPQSPLSGLFSDGDAALDTTRLRLASPWRQLHSIGIRRTVEALRLRLAEGLLSSVTVSAFTTNCECFVGDGGFWDCVGDRDSKACLPNTPHPNEFCTYLDQGCGMIDGHECDGVCYEFPSLDRALACQAGGWDPLLGRCTETPIVVDLTGAGIRLTSQREGVLFDMGGNGLPHLSAWIDSGSGAAWLALDRDGDGTIGSSRELFSNVTDQPAVGFPNGFLALTALDDDGDREITEADKAYSSLLLWTDDDEDGRSEADELHTLSEYQVSAISLRYRQSGWHDQFGNEFRYRAAIRFADGAERWIRDVNLANNLGLISSR